MSCNLAPIVLFVYNRPEHTRRTVEALRANRLAPQSRLFVFSDGPKNDSARPAVDEVRRYVASIDGFASVDVTANDENHGLAASVISGVSQVVEEFNKVIVLEDDLLTSPYFLDYMNEGLELYKEDEEVASVQAHMFPLKGGILPRSFFLPVTGSWGWGAWSRSWRLFNPDAKYLLGEIRRRGLSCAFDLNHSYPYTRLLDRQVAGKIDSWAIRWYASTFLLNKISLFPASSFVKNTGFDGSGVHCGRSDPEHFNTSIVSNYTELGRVVPEVNKRIVEDFQKSLREVSWEMSLFSKLKRIVFVSLGR